MKASEAEFSTVFFHGSFRPEVVGDVISGANVGQVGVDVPVKLGESSSNGSRDAVVCGILDHFLNFDNCQLEVVSDVISGMVDQDGGKDVYANFGDSRRKPCAGVIFGRFSNVHNFRPEVHSDFISGAIVDPTGVKVRVKCGDSRPNRSRDIRLSHIVTNDNDDAGRRTLRQ